MNVILVRHAIAHERNRGRWPDDARRPLTAEGVHKFRKAARGLASCLPADVTLLTSPYVRARETAAILATVARRPRAVECVELAASSSIDAVFGLLRARREKAVVLVGHEPNLSQFLAAALAGPEARLDIEFKKGGAACVQFAGRALPGRAKLRWFLPPRVLRALR